jgi:glycosyltransferase involved in cell wall biosynthesis
VGSGQTLIGHAGALVDAHKGQKLLIDAARALLQRGYQFQLIFMGDGPDRNELKAYASGLPCVRFLGQIDDIAEHISALDVFAFPSRHEGLGSVLIDVMAAGVPIIATDVGGIPDLVDHGRSGWVIPAGDSEALASGLSLLIKNRSLAKDLANEARIKATYFSLKAMAESYIPVYQLDLKFEEYDH